MKRLQSCRAALWILSRLFLPCFVFACAALAQVKGITTQRYYYPQILNQDEQIEVHNLPSLMAKTPHSSDVLLTSLDTVLHDREICCGRDSALEDAAQAADPKSLKDAATKLDGRHLMGDGRPIKVTAEFLSPDQAGSGRVITAIANQHAPLMEWNSHIYVVHGVVFFWAAYSGGDEGYTPVTVIHKFLLWDTRYSDSRREVEFDRTTEDLSKVQGLLFLDWKPQ